MVPLIKARVSLLRTVALHANVDWGTVVVEATEFDGMVVDEDGRTTVVDVVAEIDDDVDPGVVVALVVVRPLCGDGVHPASVTMTIPNNNTDVGRRILVLPLHWQFCDEVR